MKAPIGAISILLAITIFIGFGVSYVDHSTDNLTDEITKARDYFLSDENDKASESINQFLEEWYQNKKFFHAFVNRDKLDDIELLTKQLIVYNAQKEETDFLSTLGELKEKLAKIYEDQETTFSNIF